MNIIILFLFLSIINLLIIKMFGVYRRVRLFIDDSQGLTDIVVKILSKMK